MLIVQLDEPTLFVFEDSGEAEREIEALDADEVRAAFDGDGVPYCVEMITPNTEVELALGLKVVESGTYWFKPSGPPSPEALASLIERNLDAVEPPGAGAVLQDLLTRLRPA